MNAEIVAVSKPMVLVVDDDVTIRVMARECLEAYGFDVAEAEDGFEAVEVFGEARPDAVVLDVMMPRIDGFEVCRRIRALPGNEHLPILMMTALDDVDSIHASYAAGATEFTSKPVNWIAESHRLHNMLASARAFREVQMGKLEWERTFNALDEVVTIHDVDTVVIQANAAAAAMVGVEKEALLGRPCWETYCKRAETCGICPLKEVIATGRGKKVEVEDWCFPGFFQVTVVPVCDAEGNLVRVVQMSRDITELKRLEKEVRCAQKMDAVGTLAGGLAHDFNNLLQVIMGYVSLIQLDFLPEDEIYKNLSEVIAAVVRGGEITHQLMAVSRNVESRKVPMLLNEAIENVHKLLSRTFPKMITFELELSDGLDWINADSAQIEQVLMNLAVNAKHAMPKGGVLRLETRNVVLDGECSPDHPSIKAGSYVLLRVSDSGCGMDEETLLHIFEPFFTTRSPDEGSGLGLAMVYGIVKKHEGFLFCESVVGEGTSFKLYLPALSEKEVAPARPRLLEAAESGGNERILLVDDVEQIRQAIGQVLVSSGYDVLLGVDGADALDILAQEPVDLVILDLNMPVMGGVECLRRLRQRGYDLPVLLASGLDMDQDSLQWLGESVDFVEKPYDKRSILAAIHKMLGGRLKAA